MGYSFDQKASSKSDRNDNERSGRTSKRRSKFGRRGRSRRSDVDVSKSRAAPLVEEPLEVLRKLDEQEARLATMRQQETVDDKLDESSGRPLPPAQRRRLEKSFDASLAEVTVHDDAPARKAAADLNTTAFATGERFEVREKALEPAQRPEDDTSWVSSEASAADTGVGARQPLEHYMRWSWFTPNDAQTGMLAPAGGEAGFSDEFRHLESTLLEGNVAEQVMVLPELAGRPEARAFDLILSRLNVSAIDQAHSTLPMPTLFSGPPGPSCV